jgi:hypothetical protein
VRSYGSATCSNDVLQYTGFALPVLPWRSTFFLTEKKRPITWMKRGVEGKAFQDPLSLAPLL